MNILTLSEAAKAHALLTTGPEDVLLVGAKGAWGMKSWVPPLCAMHDRGVISLTFCDLAEEPSPALAEVMRKHGVPYVSNANLVGSAAIGCEAAVIAVPACAQHEASLKLLREAPRLKTLLLEKPGAFSKAQAESLAKHAEYRGVALYLMDHYLCRAEFVEFLDGKDAYLEKIGRIKALRGWLTERQAIAPAGPSTIDLASHLVNMFHRAWPEAHIDVEAHKVSRAIEAPPHLTDSFGRIRGKFVFPERSVPIEFVVGKLLSDRKFIEIEGEMATLRIDLAAHTLSIDGKEIMKCSEKWSYAPVLAKIFSPSRP